MCMPDIAAIEAEQLRLIDVYRSELWCPERPLVGPRPLVLRHAYRAQSRWIRHLDHEDLRVRSFAEVLEMIRAA